jgi:hypothetical protein
MIRPDRSRDDRDMRTWSSLALAVGTVSTAVVVAALTGCGDVPAGGAAARTQPVPTAPGGAVARHQAEDVVLKQPAAADLACPGPAGH